MIDWIKGRKETVNESCSECKDCSFSWHYSRWCCTFKEEFVLGNDVFLSVHDKCPKKTKQKTVSA